MAINIARRRFIAALGGTAFAWPLAARAQQPVEGIRRISVLMNTTSDDPEGRARVAAFAQALQKLGWTEGGNVRTDIRWAVDDADRYRRYSEELVALAPHVILASAPRAWRRYSRSRAGCLSCSRTSLIRSVQDSSRAWHDRLATPPDLFRSNTA